MSDDASAIAKGEIFDTAVASGTPFFGTALQPIVLRDGTLGTAFRITVQFDVPAKLIAVYDDGSSEVDCTLNAGNDLTAGALHTFTIGVRSAFTVNFKADDNVNVDLMLVDEVIGNVL